MFPQRGGNTRINQRRPAALIEKAADLWGKAGQRSLARSALVEAAEQLTRALDQIAALPATPALRREEVKLEVALINPLMAKALGEPPEDPLLLFSILYGFWVANDVAFNGNVCRDLAAQFQALAEKEGAIVPLMIGHRLMGSSLLHTGDIAASRSHYDQAIALYDL